MKKSFVIILLGSLMTGTVGWLIGGQVSIEHVFSRYLILVFAMAGGAPLGASVGVVTGLILSLASSAAVYQIGLLAFSGLLAGLLKDGRRLAVSFGLLLGSSILVFYIGEGTPAHELDNGVTSGHRSVPYDPAQLARSDRQICAWYKAKYEVAIRLR